MQPAAFDYHRPGTIEEAVDLLGRVEGARVLAGGHSLLPAMKLRLSSPPALVDLGRIAGLSGVTAENGSLSIGALTTHAEIEHSGLIEQECPILAEAAATIGDPAVRNRGTIGGSLAHADPAADLPTVITALGATVIVTGKGGEREIAAADFFTGLFATSLGRGEVVTSIRVPKLGAGTGTAYVKHRHPASSYAVVGVAAIVHAAGGAISGGSVAIGGATANPVVLDVIPGEDPAAATSASVAGAITRPIGDLYASGEYRVHLAGVLTKRALTTAIARTA